MVEHSDECNYIERQRYFEAFNNKKLMMKQEMAKRAKVYTWTETNYNKELQAIEETEDKECQIITIPFSTISMQEINTHNKYYTAIGKIMKLPLNNKFTVIEDTNNTEKVNIIFSSTLKDAII